MSTCLRKKFEKKYSERKFFPSARSVLLFYSSIFLLK